MAKSMTKLNPGVIKDVVVHSDYIAAFQSIMLYYVDQIYPKSSDLAVILQKFKGIMDGSIDIKDAKLKWYEYHTWIFYSMLQTLSTKAAEQGMYQDTEVQYDEDVLGKLTKAILERDTESQKELYAKFFNDVEAKLDAEEKSS